MLALKQYQRRALDALSDYFRQCNQLGRASLAFVSVTEEIFGQGRMYTPVQGLAGLPYVCIRLPTGGGKTLVACHAAGIAARELLKTDHPVILWLVPSNAIREQTIQALKDRGHPYRQACDAEVGPVSVLDVVEALYLTRATVDTSTTIIVSTMQAFRVGDTEGRKVYESSGALMEHFDGLDDGLKEILERDSGGVIPYSLANVLRIHRPIVIVDEAHNARTGLSFETLARFNPSCILEFTATPDRSEHPSNVLYSASAAELNVESMIKLPIWLETRSDWKQLLADAVGRRAELETLARLERQQTGEYIRPILLIQAQPTFQNRSSLTVEVVRRHLIEDNQISEDQIARATGQLNEIDGVNLADPSCPIRFVITIQALREGWDCPFAYVLCSVAEVSSATQVEQLLGRILRLPKATAKQHQPLNLAYAYVASANFSQAANSLTDALVQNGFERQDARDFILSVAPYQPRLLNEWPADDSYSVSVSEPLDLTQLPADVQERVEQHPDGKLVFRGVMEERDKRYLQSICASPLGQDAIEGLFLRSRGLLTSSPTPATQVLRFAIPFLSYRQGDLVEQLEDTHFLSRPWRLSERDAALDEAEFPTEVAGGQIGEIQITDQGHFHATFISDLQQQMALLNTDQGWSVAELVNWLDRSIPHPDITATESGVFLTRLIQSLFDDRGLAIDQLLRSRYRLREAVASKIARYRRAAHQQAFQALLFPEDQSPVTVEPDRCFTYDPDVYPYSTRYQGAYQFQKHYYPVVGNLGSVGEEFRCAQFLDSMVPEIKSWVRNLDQRPTQSFWLQTSTDRFYPDFVCLLNDGRYLVVEYKGEDRWSNADSTEKRNIGELWAKRSSGGCLFVMPRGEDLSAIGAKIRARP